jgi:hypothetical protein
MPNKWHICKEGQASNKKRKSRGLLQKEKAAACLCFLNYLAFLRPAADRALSILPWVVSPGRSYGFLWAVRLFKENLRKDNLTPAYSPVSDRRRLTALVEVHCAQGVQAPIPKFSRPDLQENHIIETCKEEGCAVSTKETVARRKWEMEHLTHLSAPWTDSRPHPRIANQLAGGNEYDVNL